MELQDWFELLPELQNRITRNNSAVFGLGRQKFSSDACNSFRLCHVEMEPEIFRQFDLGEQKMEFSLMESTI